MLRPAPGPRPFPYTTLFRSRRGLLPHRGAAREAGRALPVGRVVRRPAAAGVAGLRRAGGRSGDAGAPPRQPARSEEHTSELQSLTNLLCRLLLEKTKLLSAS